MPTTIRDVAKALNLSITTVSRALDGYDDVAAETRQRVISAAQEMGYTPNRAARQLRRQRTDTIGYILPTAEGGFADPFASAFIAGLGDEAAAHNYDLLVSTAAPNSPQEQALYRHWVQGGKVDGIIINHTRLNDWRLDFLTESGMRYVTLDRSPTQTHFIGIEVDAQSGYADLIGHLVMQGHSRIAYIGGPAMLKMEHDRQNAYQNALRAHGITPQAELITHANLTTEGGYQAAMRLLNLHLPPTAIVCINDLTAFGAMHAVHERGLKVGRDVAVAGFDGIADSAHTQPPLTTLHQPVHKIARQLVQLLLAQLNRQTSDTSPITIRPNLLIRASTGG